MARKTIIPNWLDKFRPANAPDDELRAFEKFVAASNAHDKAWKEFDAAAEKFERKPAYRDDFYKAQRQVEKSFTFQMGAYNAWQYTRTHKIHVPKQDILQIVTDALMGGREALGWDGTGLESHRAAESLSASILAELQTIGVRIVEEEQVVPYCSECA
jgi:hypothetical protein